MWIVAHKKEKGLLEKLGVQVGEYNHEEGCFDDCVVSEKTLEALDPHWGEFYWGLDPNDEKGVHHGKDSLFHRS